MKIDINKDYPRLPLDGKLDLTYRCNNACRHCWLWLPQDSYERGNELSFEEWRQIIDQARAMGCQAWSISGGEPMLRPDFAEIFDYLTRKAVSYKLNTNGTLITPEIARLLTRGGDKMVALYGATADVHDYVTRTPGSFEAAMRGFAYLKEAGAPFTVQLVPMRANYHQFDQMQALARSLSSICRVGAPWLWLSDCPSDARNREIAAQRLDPKEVVVLDRPNPAAELIDKLGLGKAGQENPIEGAIQPDDRLFASCIANRRDFHIDPYGMMSFCYFIKDPALRYDLRQGTFQEAWDQFIPSLADTVRGGQEYLENCGSCELRNDCRWCAVYGYLEHGRYAARVNYLCQAAAANRQYKEDWRMSHLRYYQIAGITLQVSADFPITNETFAAKFEKFMVDGPGKDTIAIELASGVPTLAELRLGKEIYHRPPYAIHQQRDSWVYRGIHSDDDAQTDPRSLVIVNKDYSHMTICRDGKAFAWKNLHSLTTLPSDQILLAPALAEREACFMHSSAIVINGRGLLFVGHSEVGKSTMMKMLRGQGEILCDDRNIIRRWQDGFRIHGTWSHGELPDVSSAEAPLVGIFFLQQAKTNQLILINSMRERLDELLAHVVRPLLTADWWEKTLNLAGKIANEVPIYRLKFDKSGQVVDVLKPLYE